MHRRMALIIEDEEDLADLFAMALSSAGFETEVIRSGDMAMARLGMVAPDIVILDLHLPGVGGRSILHRIRSDPRLAGTRVIISTADAQMAQMVQDQADLVLIKPVSLPQVRDLAARLGFAER